MAYRAATVISLSRSGGAVGGLLTSVAGSLSSITNRSKPAGVFSTSSRAGASTAVRKPCGTPRGPYTNVPGPPTTRVSPHRNVIVPSST